MWLFATFTTQNRSTILCPLISFPTWQLHFLWTQMCFLYLGRHRIPLTQPQKNVCFGLFCQQWAWAEWKKEVKEKAGHLLLAQLLSFAYNLHDLVQIMLVSHSAFVENDRREHDNTVLEKQRWLIKWTSGSPLQVKVQNYKNSNN